MSRNIPAMKFSGLLLRQLQQHVLPSSKFGNMVSEASKISGIRGIGVSIWNPIPGARNWSSMAPNVGKEEKTSTAPTGAVDSSEGQADHKAVVSYWGVAPPNITKEDGSPWRWNCFRPWETYKADTSIDVKKHHEATTLNDKLAYWIVQSLKYPTTLFFQRRHMCHAMLLETVAAVPGMVGGMLLHLRSLRRFEHSGGWIKALLEEAENERMHLMTFLELSQPKWYERALVFAVQGVFFNGYFLAYLASPKLAHRITGYLEEEAVNSYTEFLIDLEKGLFENKPAPAIAIDYWRLPPDSTLKDVVTVIRADEAHHRDINHFASDIQCQGHELKDFSAPIGYH
ncbi:ubiquinol oxidase 2, mitochondrial-like [Coffea arabica]|uniref:Ubiquinol oxidase n=1 Tax=Coffea arabica TaxID=13443 RepID=A0A6P6TQA2_COFAR|nr:ubiquinol oxidase 2, mitochondrial-like [Coffea arabica]XP_027080658.1 ubiquinol oxidase 2, mitochondrial-like [Coffea arabica]